MRSLKGTRPDAAEAVDGGSKANVYCEGETFSQSRPLIHPLPDDLVSAIIPVRDGERWIEQAVASVLQQSYSSIDCIVVDDGSTDGTRAVLERFRAGIRIIDSWGVGVSRARNQGAEAATGRYLAFLDADDVWHPDKIARQVTAIHRLPNSVGALCSTAVVGSDLVELTTIDVAPWPPTREALLLRKGGAVSTSSNLLVDAATFHEIGGFRPDLSTSADWDLLLRLIERYELAYVREPLVRYRRHASNMSHDVAQTGSDSLAAYRAAFARIPESPLVQRRAYAALHRMLAGSFLAAGHLGGFTKHILLAARFHPTTAFSIRKNGWLRRRLAEALR